VSPEVEKTIKAGAVAAASDAGSDSTLANLAAVDTSDGAQEDLRYRMQTMANNVAEGRTINGLDGAMGTAFNDIRGQALAQADALAQMAAGGAAAPNMAFKPTEADKLAAAKAEVWSLLKKDFDHILGGKLSPAEANAAWARMQQTGDADVSQFSRELLDGQASPTDLDSARTKLTLGFYNLLRNALDQGTAQDVATQMLARMQKDLGDKLAKAYQGQIKSAVGDPLARAFSAGKDQAQANQQRADSALRQAIDATRGQLAAGATMLDQAGDRLKDPKSAAGEAGTLQALSAVVKSAGTDLATAAQGTQIPDATLTAQLADATAKLAAAGTALDNAAKSASANQAAAAEKAVSDVKAQLAAINTKLDQAGQALDQQDAAAAAAFAKAVVAARGDGDSGIEGMLNTRFTADFRKQALPALSKAAVAAYERRLAELKLDAPADTQTLETEVATALDKRITGGAVAPGATALQSTDQGNVLADAAKSQGPATAGAVARAGQIARDVADSGMADAASGGQLAHDLGNWLKGTGGPTAGVTEVKNKLAQLEIDALAGRGGVLTGDGGAGAEAGGTGGGTGGAENGALAALRAKYLGKGAGAGGEGDGSDQGGALADAAAAGAGEGQGEGAAGHGGRAGAGAAGGQAPLQATLAILWPRAALASPGSVCPATCPAAWPPRARARARARPWPTPMGTMAAPSISIRPNSTPCRPNSKAATTPPRPRPIWPAREPRAQPPAMNSPQPWPRLRS
jgi:hypothetical protein